MSEAPVPQSKYHPLNLEEFQKLEAELKTITTFLPEGQMRYIWEMVNKVRGERISQPCACKSSSGLWTRAIEDLRKFVDERK